MQIVRTVRVGHSHLAHVLFPTEDDRIEVQDEQGKPLLIYDANCNILAPEGRIGSFCVEGDHWVSYHGPVRTRRVHRRMVEVDGLIDSEVEFTKMYLAERNLPLVESEGGHCD